MSEVVKKFVSISIWVTIILFSLRCAISWRYLSAAINDNNYIDFGYLVFGYAGEAIGLATIFMACFNKWWWRWKPLNRLSNGMPVLGKNYKGKICYKYNDSNHERESEIRIDQTFLNVMVKFRTLESSSTSVTATIETINNEKQLVFSYINIPKAEIQDRSAIHYGTAILKLDDPKHLIGNYYTSRLSRGSMDFEIVGEK